jgi:hypothetical protein
VLFLDIVDRHDVAIVADARESEKRSTRAPALLDLDLGLDLGLGLGYHRTAFRFGARRERREADERAGSADRTAGCIHARPVRDGHTDTRGDTGRHLQISR